MTSRACEPWPALLHLYLRRAANRCFLQFVIVEWHADMPRTRNNEQGVIFEFISIGNYVKVSAVDTRSGTEVSIVGDPRRGEAALRRVAMRKLQNQVEKRNSTGSPGRLV